MERQIFYRRAADCFEESILLGNGRLGAVCYGGAEREKIVLNEDTIYSGTKGEHRAPENAPQIWKKIGKLSAEGKDFEARAAALEFTGEENECFLPLATLNIEMKHGGAEDYVRRLVFSEGINYIDYIADGIHFSREVFVSKDYDCVAVHFGADRAGAVGMKISIFQPLKIERAEFFENLAVFDGVAPSAALERNSDNPIYVFDDEEDSIHFTSIFRIEAEGGEVKNDGESFFVEGADEVTVYVYTKTNFGGAELPFVKYHEPCKEQAMRPINYAAVRAAHIRDFSALYNRAELCLSCAESRVPTDERIISFDGNDLGLYELLFNYGRYLMISSSRPGSMATNLQGIWNERKTAMWNSAYTVNINTQMNYWPTHMTNLGECFEPFVELLKTWQRTGRRTAKEYYGAPGFVCHHNSSIWGHTNPTGRGREYSYIWAFWNMASGWMACQLYDEYEYTMDKERLREYIYPIMKEAAEFYLHIMVCDENGKYMVSPSTSPENRFIIGEGEDTSISRTTAMTASILYELFEKLIRGAYILDLDYEFREQLEEILPKLYMPQIGADGRLMEWYEERTELEPQHRHVSHLFGLYPGETIHSERTPELAEACKKSLIARGDGGTGWSLAWKVNLWAGLRDGNHALTVLKRQLKYVDPKAPVDYVNGGGIYTSLMDAHPPFQIDGNFGVCAGIARMLMQSEVGRLWLLPALPNEFKNGHVRGLKAKGNIDVSIWWENGELSRAELCSSVLQSVEVNVRGRVMTVELGKDTVII